MKRLSTCWKAAKAKAATPCCRFGSHRAFPVHAANQLTSATDRDGRTITYGYDQAGRMTNETWVSGSYTATFSYNKDSLVTLAQDPSSQYTYSYNADKGVTSVDNAGTPGVPTVTLSYSYDGFQNVTGLTDSLGGSVAYGYDKNNQLNSLALSVSSTLDAQVTMGYDTANRLTGITRTGASGSDTITSALSYDNANRLTNITHTDTTSSTTLANYTYGYDQGNQLTSYTDNSSNSLTYGYDANGQLTSASGTLNGSSYSVSYSYDTNGNRNMTGYTTGTGNELKSDGTYSYTYDNNGNLTTQTTIATGSVTYYTWDYRNRLTEVKQEASGGTVINDEKFTYDVNNNRIGVSLNGTQQLYTVYNGKNPYIDFNGSGTLTQRYLVDPQTLSQFYGQVSGSGTTQWFLTDNINSVRQVVSSSGSVLDAITYDPYGNIVNQTNSANAPRFLYAGGAYDSNAGNYQFDARYYNPAVGRWTSQDPLGFSAGDVDLYRYVFNAPTDAIDPTGLEPPKIQPYPPKSPPEPPIGPGPIQPYPPKPPTPAGRGGGPTPSKGGWMGKIYMYPMSPGHGGDEGSAGEAESPGVSLPTPGLLGIMQEMPNKSLQFTLQNGGCLFFTGEGGLDDWSFGFGYRRSFGRPSDLWNFPRKDIQPYPPRR